MYTLLLLLTFCAIVAATAAESPLEDRAAEVNHPVQRRQAPGGLVGFITAPGGSYSQVNCPVSASLTNYGNAIACCIPDTECTFFATCRGTLRIGYDWSGSVQTETCSERCAYDTWASSMGDTATTLWAQCDQYANDWSYYGASPAASGTVTVTASQPPSGAGPTVVTVQVEDGDSSSLSAVTVYPSDKPASTGPSVLTVTASPTTTSVAHSWKIAGRRGGMMIALASLTLTLLLNP